MQNGVPAAADSAGPAGPQLPLLSFGAWFARRARRTDVALLLLELVFITGPHVTRVMQHAVCVPTGGGPHSALQAELPLLDPAARRADAVLAGFPCAAPYPRQLLYTFRTGAAVDPRLRLRLLDYANLCHLVAQLPALALAFTSLPLYELSRSSLFVAMILAPPLGCLFAAALAPTGLLALGVGCYFGSVRRRLELAVFFSWKLIVVQRPVQLFSAVYVAGCIQLLLTLRCGRGGDAAASSGASDVESSRQTGGGARTALYHMAVDSALGEDERLRGALGVLAGPTGLSGGRQQRPEKVHLDDFLFPAAGPGPVGGATFECLGPLAIIRLALPPAALCAPGALMIHVLPPPLEPHAAEASAPISRAAEQQQQQQQQWLAAAPLASLPLLVLPPTAAQEIRRLFEEVLGAEAVACLDGLLSRQAGGGQDQQCPLADAAAIVESSGMYDVVYDMGSLLSMPYSDRAASGAEAHAEGGSLPPQPVEEPRVFDGLMRLFASRGMEACLREALRILEAGGGVRPAELSGASAGGGGTLGRPPRGPAWWLRALLWGFQSPAQEAAYQDFKAAQLVGLDRMAFLLEAGLRAATVRCVYDAGKQQLPLSVAAAAGHSRPTGPALLRPEMATQCVLLAVILMVLALALLTPLHRTRRNLLLQLRGWLDSAVFLLMLMPLPAFGGPLLAVPDASTLPCRRRSLHWTIFCLWEPALMQAGSWLPALLFGAAFAAGTMAVSAATDLRMRRRFLLRFAGGRLREADAEPPAGDPGVISGRGSGTADDSGNGAKCS
ncbi:hypothetical protein GPECTOR_13g784 [Gonium pectorale]|uniref:Uncharacterized protein n=1 Tax=Gonium pectorale TaxID=33097 RepID=A0A150GNA5_GONPE|nr:hypothetical protein GPECTOR_13g784 [Gonium pectorale]|eukprot:KXZ51297.1 hypothetical protein GPECTOR_13g784 [Gonium pectorale]